MTFAREGDLVAWAHAWLDVDDLFADIHLLTLAIALESESFKADGLLASVVEFLKSAFHRNGQIAESRVESIQVIDIFGLEPFNLSAVLIKGHCEWIECSEKLLEYLKRVSLELVSCFESELLVWNSRLHELFSILVIDVFKFWGAEHFISLANLRERIGGKGQLVCDLILVRMSLQSHLSETGSDVQV